jgi:hypothetical protein
MTTTDHAGGGADAAMASLGAWSRGTAAIAAEMTGYAKESLKESAEAWEKLACAKGIDRAMEVQGAYMKSAYAHFVAHATRLGELYVDLAKESYKPVENALARAKITT